MASSKAATGNTAAYPTIPMLRNVESSRNTPLSPDKERVLLTIIKTRRDVARRLPQKTGAADNTATAKKTSQARMSSAKVTESHLNDTSEGSHDCPTNSAW